MNLNHPGNDDPWRSFICSKIRLANKHPSQYSQSHASAHSMVAAMALGASVSAWGLDFFCGCGIPGADDRAATVGGIVLPRRKLALRYSDACRDDSRDQRETLDGSHGSWMTCGLPTIPRAGRGSSEEPPVAPRSTLPAPRSLLHAPRSLLPAPCSLRVTMPLSAR